MRQKIDNFKAKIVEVFKSLQGEGIYQGKSQVFVRFFDCNLKCGFCDTKLKTYSELSVEDILARINDYDEYDSISVTGGEPLLDIDFLQEFLKVLKNQGKKIYLESNGTLANNLEKVIDYVDIISMDFKLPSSTGEKGYWFQHREFLRIASRKDTFIKAVITQSTIIEDVRIAMAIIKEVGRGLPFILQPQNPFEDILQPKIDYFLKVCKENNMDVKVIPQMHKKLGIK